MKKLKFSLSNAEVLTRDQQRSINGGSSDPCMDDSDCIGGKSCINNVCTYSNGDCALANQLCDPMAPRGTTSRCCHNLSCIEDAWEPGQFICL